MNRARWLEALFRPLIVGVMVGCIALSLVEWVHLFSPAWNATYVFVACVLAALEAHYSYRQIHARALDSIDAWKFRGIELVMLLLLLKIGSYIGDSWADVLADIRTWSDDLLNVIDLETAFASILAFLSWYASTQTARDLERLDEPGEFQRHERPPLESLTARFYWGGGVLLFVSGLTRVGIAHLLDVARPSVPGLVLNVLVYFVLGLVMLGQVRFVALRQEWQAQKIEISSELAGRWVRYSLWFVGLAALLAFLLPTGYTIGLLDIVSGILGLIFVIINVISMLFFLLILLPFGLLARLFRDDAGRPLRFGPLIPRLSRFEPRPAAPNWLEVLRSLVFWAVAVGVVSFVVYRYVRDRPELWNALMAFKPIRLLYGMWAALWRRLGRWSEGIRIRLPRRSLRERKRTSRSTAPFFWLGPRSPREQVLYYYLGILRRAGRKGFPRRPPQTPYEYDDVLKPNLPEAQQEMDLLTRSFVEARYSQHVVEPEQAARARLGWQRVKTALRALGTRSAGGRETD